MTSEFKARYAIASILFHLVVIGAFLVPSCTNKGYYKKEEPLTLFQYYGKTHIEEQGDNPMLLCKDQYEGVGVMYDRNTGRISEAPPSYPGYKAGLRVDDAFETYSMRISSDHWMDADVSRMGRMKHYHIRTTTVCRRNHGE